jgi:hypothetical protein
VLNPPATVSCPSSPPSRTGVSGPGAKAGIMSFSFFEPYSCFLLRLSHWAFDPRGFNVSIHTPASLQKTETTISSCTRRPAMPSLISPKIITSLSRFYKGDTGPYSLTAPMWVPVSQGSLASKLTLLNADSHSVPRTVRDLAFILYKLYPKLMNSELYPRTD